jgi:hypothetical protein
MSAEDLTIVTEAEAASIYCQYLPYAMEVSSATTFGVVKPGTKYMLVHLRRGTHRLSK